MLENRTTRLFNLLLMRFLCLVLLTLLSFTTVEAKLPTLNIEGVTFVAADKLGYVYVVRDDRITKYNSQLEPIARYASAYGTIHSVDVSNPFKAVVFCKDFVRVILLDNKLAELGLPLFLPDIDIVRPLAVCGSADNALWVADDYSQQLTYYDLTTNVRRVVCSLSNYYTPNASPSYLVESNGLLYVNFSNSQIITFDKFGTLVGNTPLQVPSYFAVNDHRIYYLKNAQIQTLPLSTTAVSLGFSTPEVKLFAITAKHTILYTEKLDLFFLD